MKIKLITPEKPIFQIFYSDSFGETECLIIQAENKEHAGQILQQYLIENEMFTTEVWSNTQIDLITEDK